MTVVLSLQFNSGIVLANDCLKTSETCETYQGTKTHWGTNESKYLGPVCAFFITPAGDYDPRTNNLFNGSQDTDPFKTVLLIGNQDLERLVLREAVNARRIVETTGHGDVEYSLIRVNYSGGIENLTIRNGIVTPSPNPNSFGSGKEYVEESLKQGFQSAAEDPDLAVSVVSQSLNLALLHNKYKGYQIFRVRYNKGKILIEYREDLDAKKVPESAFNANYPFVQRHRIDEDKSEHFLCQ